MSLFPVTEDVSLVTEYLLPASQNLALLKGS